MPNVHPHVGAERAGERAGLKTDDVVLDRWQPITFSHMRKRSQTSEQQIRCRFCARRSRPHTTPARGAKGLASAGDDIIILKPGFGEAIKLSVQKNIEMARLIFQTLGGLFTRETSPKQLMGPIAIAQLSGESAQLGWIALITLMASISLNLGLLNLMPVPVLDGGHIFIMALEGLAQHRLARQSRREDADSRFCGHPDADGDSHYNDLTRITWIGRNALG